MKTDNLKSPLDIEKSTSLSKTRKGPYLFPHKLKQANESMKGVKLPKLNK